MARRNDSLRCTTRLRSTSVNRMRRGREMPRRRTSSTSSLRSREWPLPSAWTVTFPLSLMPKYPAPQLRTPYVSKASARDQGCGGEVGIVRSGPPGGLPGPRERAQKKNTGGRQCRAPCHCNVPVTRETVSGFPGNTVQFSRIASSTCSTCPSTFTFGHTLATLPEPSIRKVERLIPMNFRPYSDFSPQAPYFSETEWSTSASNGKGSSYFPANFAWLGPEAGLTPSTTAPAFGSAECSSRKAHASRVDPGVSSFG